jgi:dipeptidyl aminopeptidase/acylaminoacyl peptidase
VVPDGTKLLFGDKDLRVFVVDVATKKLTKIAESNQLANDEFSWEISDYAWSPDGAWVAYAQIEPNRNGRIWLHEVATGKTVPVTDGFYHSVNPSFDAKGELLYFLSYRSFTTRVDVFEDNHVIRSRCRSPSAPRRPEAAVREGAEGRGEERRARARRDEGRSQGRKDAGDEGGSEPPSRRSSSTSRDSPRVSSRSRSRRGPSST